MSWKFRAGNVASDTDQEIWVRRDLGAIWWSNRHRRRYRQILRDDKHATLQPDNVEAKHCKYDGLEALCGATLQPADPKNLVSMSLFNSPKASNPTGVFWLVPFRSLIELPVPNVPRLHQPNLLDSVLVDRRRQCHGSQPCRKTASSHNELFLSRF